MGVVSSLLHFTSLPMVTGQRSQRTVRCVTLAAQDFERDRQQRAGQSTRAVYNE